MSFQSISEHQLQLCLERDRLLCSPEFARSPVMTKLLKFLVDHKLHEGEAKLKAYTIAVDALGRSDDFDPQSDSYPRVQIGRLRKMLDAFYAIEGGETRLILPIGTYEIDIIGTIKTPQSDESEKLSDKDMPELASEALADPTKGKAARWLAFGSISALILSFAVWHHEIFETSEPSVTQYPSLVLHAPELSNVQRDSDLANQTSNMFANSLSLFEAVNVRVAEQGEKISADYGLKLKFLDGAKTTITLLLIRTKDNEVIWSRSINEQAGSERLMLALQRAIIQVVGPYGAITQDMRTQLGGSMRSGYPCMLQFDNYLRYREEKQLAPIVKCAEQTLRDFPNDALFMSWISYVNYLANHRLLQGKSDRKAQRLAQDAVRINPNSATAKFALARIEFFQGKCDAGKKWGDRAVEQNPLDTRILGYFSIYLSACHDPGAEKMAQRALDLDPGVDLIVPSNLAVLMFQKGDRQGAYELSSQFLADAQRDEPSLMVIGSISAAYVGRKQESQMLWRRVTDHFGLPENTRPRVVLEKFIVNKQLVDGLEKVIQATSLASVKSDPPKLKTMPGSSAVAKGS